MPGRETFIQQVAGLAPTMLSPATRTAAGVRLAHGDIVPRCFGGNGWSATYRPSMRPTHLLRVSCFPAV